MKASDLISHTLKPAVLGTDVEEVLELLNSLSVSCLPVVDGNKVLGMISVAELYMLQPDDFISDYIQTAKVFRISDLTHEFEMMRFFAESDYPVLAVVNEKDEFIGIVSALDLISELEVRMGRMLPFGKSGGIVTLEMKRTDLHMSEIARIVESNDMKIVALYVGQPYDQSPDIEVHLRVDRPDIKSLLATFERFNYNIVSSTLSHADWQEMEDRYKAFLKYLNY
jgi:CBS domain-containing protein